MGTGRVVIWGWSYSDLACISLCASMSVCVSLYVSAYVTTCLCIPVCMQVCVCDCLFPPICLYIHLCLCLSLPVSLPASLPVSLPASLPASPSFLSPCLSLLSISLTLFPIQKFYIHILFPLVTKWFPFIFHFFRIFYSSLEFTINSSFFHFINSSHIVY
jgi:hypothetical protein